MFRIAVFTGDLSYVVRKTVVELDRRSADLEWLIVRHAPPRAVRRLVRSQFRNLRRNGWRWIPYQAAEILRAAWRRRADGATPVSDGRPGGEYELRRVLARPNVQYLQTPDIHGDEALEAVRRFAPHLGLSLAAPILKPAVFEIPGCGTLNLHQGKLPEYRGMPPAFWELWNGETEVGCTIHRVEAGLDTGAVVAEATTPIHPFSTLRGLQLTLDEIGVGLMCDAVAGIRAGTLAFRSQGPGGRTNRKPTLGQVARLRHRMAAREKARAGLAHRSAKYAYLLTRLLVGRVRNAIAKPPITVILYHRVGDALRDSLTTGIEQFDRQMALIERTCHPVSIEDVVSGRLPHSPRRPMVCVTFDDGYRDNFAIAAPILLRHRIPAAFFVSTGIVGTSRPFPHDRGKVPAALENMSWDELRQLSRCGFVIGSHTVNHIDCAAASADTVERELRTSLATLRSELGLRDVILAYPFGGREHMTPERLELVKRAGYAGCLSAYGGFNRGEVDRFNVLRCGVNWGFSDLAFRCRIFGIL